MCSCLWFHLEEYRQLGNFVEYGDVPVVQNTNAEHFIFFLFLVYFFFWLKALELFRIICQFYSFCNLIISPRKTSTISSRGTGRNDSIYTGDF